MSEIETYIHSFSRLKRGGTKYGPAPHKPVLLLTLLELIERGIVSDNRFEVNVDLVNQLDTLAEDREIVLKNALMRATSMDFNRLSLALRRYGHTKTKKLFQPVLAKMKSKEYVN